MAQMRSLILYNGSDSLPAVDYTNDTDWTQTELAGMANLGDAAAGSWLLRDEPGVIPDYTSPGKYLDAHNVLIATVGSNTLFRGRLAAQEHFRGRQKAGRASEWTLTLEDQNWHLRGIMVHNWVRPAETDRARALALVAAYLNGSPRATTVLTTGLISSSNTVSLPAKTYFGVTPYEIMQELAANADKETFVTVDNELAYFGHDSTAYASSIRISDDPADANATTYAPIDPRSSEFGRQKLSTLRVYYGPDQVAQTTALSNSVAPLYDYWEDVFWDSQSASNAQAIARAQKQLDYRSVDDVSYSCSIGPMTGDEIWRIKPGQQIQFKARAARGGRGPTGTFLGDSFLTTRIRELRWTMPAEDVYFAHLELERPKRISVPSAGNQALALMPGEVVAGATIATFELTISLRAGSDLVSVYIAAGFHLGGGAQFIIGKGTFAPLSVVYWYLRDDLGTNYLGGVFPVGTSVSIVIGTSGANQYARVGTDVAVAPVSAWGALVTRIYIANNPSPNTDPNRIFVENIASGAQTIDDFQRVDGAAWGTASGVVAAWTVDSGGPVATVDGSAGTLRGSAAGQLRLTIADSNLGTTPPTAYTGAFYGQTVVGIADGATSVFTVPYPSAYQAGTLVVWVDGVEQDATETSPTTGVFTLPWAPGAGDQVSASWRVPVNL